MESKIIAFEQKLSLILSILTSCLILIATGIVFGITFCRYILGISFEWAEELVRYLILCAALVQSGPMVFDDTHVAMNFLSNKIKNPAVKYYHAIFSTVCVAALSILIFVFGLKLSLNTKMRTYSMVYNLGTVYAIIPLSMAVILIYSLLKIALTIAAGPGRKSAVESEGNVI